MRSDEPDQPSRRKVLRLSLGLLVLPGLTLPGIARAASLRVVTLFQGASDTAVALGVTPCGVVDSWSEKPMYRYLRPALAAVPHVGLETQPSLEDIVLLKPDLIVASRFRHQRIAPLLEQIAPLVMLEEVFEFKRTLAMMGAALNRQQQAMALLGQWQQRVATLREQLKARFAGRWPITVSVLDVREDHIRSYLPASFAGSVLSELGFDWTPAAREAQGVSLKLSSKESLPVVDADLFFIFQRGDSKAAQNTYEKLVQHPFWKQLRAPQDGQVWRVDAVAWSLSGGILGANLMLDEISKVALGTRSS
ncbi:ABC transporter substrate-binding protein [Pseudomonas viridiflava]|uniref:Iron-siderophore ABC transporter substrate-binding protein n=1 Tax=Pseudomonas viridiflava TaxID=33069 RepID=A0AA46VWV1_PSEVI|nr:iron-siderophore ABC transporter substrate-binding protein [Pseudomonas viridiflava]VVO17906.1 putative siderophore-binding lipoprotein YfiY [Pseudomonas fluorescens]MEE4084183.1 iron-siderophore ABC transporter substrate-binding protein [Pseudomonas viridiflava]MEE4155956.1 iron-siderophore ABC transporter substrate-binding protein [Pseudomonas viridiflava]UZA69215.1 iron-siderophore ABC transporter substrate-binding protein [Pseudomonas viridiflava]WKW30909.1 iron-siderophore ABC transpor